MAKGASGAWLTEPSGVEKPEPVWGSCGPWDGMAGVAPGGLLWGLLQPRYSCIPAMGLLWALE